MNTPAHELEIFLLDLMDRRPPDKLRYTYNSHHRRNGISVTYNISWSKSINITYDFERNYYHSHPSMRDTFIVSLNNLWSFNDLSYSCTNFENRQAFITHSYRYHSVLQELEDAASIAAKDSERNRVIRFLKKGK